MRSHGNTTLTLQHQQATLKPGLRIKQDAEPPAKYLGIMIIQVVLRVFRTFSYYGTLLLG